VAFPSLNLQLKADYFSKVNMMQEQNISKSSDRDGRKLSTHNGSVTAMTAVTPFFSAPLSGIEDESASFNCLKFLYHKLFTSCCCILFRSSIKRSKPETQPSC